LNLPINALFKLLLFLSSSLYMRLKSPATIQGPIHWARTSRNSCKNWIFAWLSCGPYTHVNHQEPLLSELN
jgi:hypothetical protein